VIVVYKIDRLTRSLADFAKLVEVFDAKSVSFVAVTQQFNTTTSMGRLTLNVLLSFAQFERELASERVRDKVAASRKKGKWMGGSVPLGYDSKDKKLVINPAEAKTVRMIFERYLALKSFQKLVDELNRKRVRTKTRVVKGKASGAVSFTYGPLAYLLKNRTYLGETGHAGSWFPGEHEPLIDRDLFEKVQDRLRTNSEGRTGRRYQTDALLTGLIFDDRGNRMSPSFSVKGGVRYRYYVSSPLVRGQKTKAGAISRIAAPPIEAEITRLVQTRIKMSRIATAPSRCCAESDKESVKPTRELVDKLFDRITIKSDRIIVILKEDPAPVEIPWNSESKGNLARIEHESTADQRNSPDPRLVQAIVRAHSWLQALSDGTYDSVEQLARVVDLHPKVVRSGIRLAFLAPDIVRKLLRGPAASHPPCPQRELRHPETRLRWLGRLDSNQGMPESKSGALPLGYAPIRVGNSPHPRARHDAHAPAALTYRLRVKKGSRRTRRKCAT
jgi:site-specific DNA recombinase